MKITIATGPIFPVPAVRGGAVQRLWEGLAREFAKRGHEVTVFAREFIGQAKDETVDGIRYVRRGGYEQSTSIKRDLVQCLIYALKTARHVPTGDVVVTNDFWMPAILPWLKPSAGKVVPCLQRFPKNQAALYGGCAALVAVSQAVADGVKSQSPSVASKVVVVPNAIDEEFLRETKRPRDQGTKRQPSLRDGLQSNQLIKDQGTAEAEPRQVAAATNGPRDQKTKSPRDKEAKGEEQWEGGKVAKHDTEAKRPVRILYVGRIHPEKGLGLLATALRLLAVKDQKTNSRSEAEPQIAQRQTARGKAEGKPEDEEPQSAAANGDSTSPVSAGRGQTKEWECVLVGPVRESEGGGGEAFVEELKRKIRELPVRFEAPMYEPSALAKVYEEADIFVYPSVAEAGESFGVAPLEAMAKGAVPVVSDLAAFREYLAPGANGMIFNHRAKDAAAELARVLGGLVADPQARERLGDAARTTAGSFSISAIADKYLQLFARLV